MVRTKHQPSRKQPARQSWQHAINKPRRIQLQKMQAVIVTCSLSSVSRVQFDYNKLSDNNANVSGDKFSARSVPFKPKRDQSTFDIIARIIFRR